MKFRLPPVYPITDKRLAGKSTHLAIVRELVRGGATLIQIRDKETPAGELLEDLTRCVEYGAKYHVQILVNDRCDLALLSGAAGAHVGMEDLPPLAARKLLGPKAVIGLSNYLPAQVIASNRLPIQYIGFGPVFATSTKPDAAQAVGLAGLGTACRKSVLPLVAIGGIELERIGEVLEAGAASAAVVSTLMKARNLARRMEQLLKAARQTGE